VTFQHSDGAYSPPHDPPTILLAGLIQRQQGNVAESLTLFQAAAFLNPNSVANLKQVARSL